jgi:hypothetical protein
MSRINGWMAGFSLALLASTGGARPWWDSPTVRKTVDLGVTAQDPHYMGRDEAGKWLFVTTAASSTTSAGKLFDFKALCKDSGGTGLLNSQSATEAGLTNQWKGAALSDELSLVLCGSGDSFLSGSDQKRSALSATNLPWASGTSAGVATLSAFTGTYVGFDNMSFSHNSSKVFSNLYQRDGSDENPNILTWTVSGTAPTNLVLTQSGSFTSPTVARVRSVNSYYINGKDLVYYGEGNSATGTAVCVYNDSTTTETVLLPSLPVTANIIQVKVACTSTSTPYLHVQLENGTVIVYALNADGLGLASTTPVATVDLTTLFGSIKRLRSFEVSDDATMLIAAPGLDSGENNLYVIGASYGLVDAVTAGSVEYWPFRLDANTYTGASKNNGNVGGTAVTKTSAYNWAPNAIYLQERCGKTFTNTFSNLLPNSPYIVEYHGAETWYKVAGARIFNITVNGVQVETNLDLYAKAGGTYYAYTGRYPTTSDANGKITTLFTTVSDNARVGGMAVWGLEPPSGVSLSVVPTSVNTNIATLSWSAKNVLACYVQTAPSADGPWTLLKLDRDQTVRSLTVTSAVNVATYYRVIASNGVGTVTQVRATSPKYVVYALKLGLFGDTVANYLCPEDYRTVGPRGTEESYGNAGSVPGGIANLADPIPGESFTYPLHTSAATFVLPNLRTDKTYDLRLYGAEYYYTGTGGRVMSVTINGVGYGNYDMVALSGGRDMAAEKVYSGLAPAADGTLTIAFATVSDCVEPCAMTLVENDSNFTPLVPAVKGAFVKDGNTTVIIGSGTPDLSYQIRRKAVGGTDYETVATIGGHLWTDMGVSSGYVYSVRAVDGNGAASGWSADTAVTTDTYKDYVAVQGNASATITGTRGDFEPYTQYTYNNQAYGVGTIANINSSIVRDPAPAAVYTRVMCDANMRFNLSGLCPYGLYMLRVHCLEEYFSERSKRLYCIYVNNRLCKRTFDVMGEVGKNNILLQEVLVQADAMGYINFRAHAWKDNANLCAVEAVRQLPQGTAGASVAYRDGATTSAERERATDVAASLAVNWSSGVPSGASATGNETTWDTTLSVPAAGAYTFTAIQSGYYSLWIDDTAVIDSRNSATSNSVISTSGTVTLAAGAHHLRARHIQGISPLQASLTWSSANFAAKIVGAPYITTDASATIGRDGWNLCEIGKLAIPGDFYPCGTAVDGTTIWRMTSSGGDIWSGTEAGLYAYRELEGEFELKARIRRMVKDEVGCSKLGIMVRTSLTTFSGLYGWTSALTRAGAGTDSAFWYWNRLGDDFTDGTSVTENNNVQITPVPPQWVRVKRYKDDSHVLQTLFSYSADGENWTDVSLTLPNSDTVYVGMVMCGVTSASLPLAEFDNFTLTIPAPKGTVMVLQ